MYYMQVHSPGTQINPLVEGMYPGPGVKTPQVDIMENTSEIIYIFEIPGVDQDSVNVEVRNNGLYIEGQTDMGIENEGLNFLYRERIPGNRFSRFVSLPQGADHKRAAASIRNGLLIVRFSKAAAAGRRLNVQGDQYPQHNQ